MAFDTCWERVKKATGMKTQSALAEFLGIRSASVTDAKNRDVFPADWAVKLAQHYGLSTDWIMVGRNPVSPKPPETGYEEVREDGQGYDELDSELENYIPDLEGFEFDQLTEGVYDSLYKKFKYVLKHSQENERYALRGFLDEIYEKVKSRRQKED